jgi:hypothetical protein
MMYLRYRCEFDIDQIRYRIFRTISCVRYSISGCQGSRWWTVPACRTEPQPGRLGLGPSLIFSRTVKFSHWPRPSARAARRRLGPGRAAPGAVSTRVGSSDHRDCDWHDSDRPSRRGESAGPSRTVRTVTVTVTVTVTAAGSHVARYGHRPCQVSAGRPPWPPVARVRATGTAGSGWPRADRHG